MSSLPLPSLNSNLILEKATTKDQQYLTQQGLCWTVFLNQVLQLIVDVLFPAIDLFKCSADFIMEFVKVTLENNILWVDSIQTVRKEYQNGAVVKKGYGSLQQERKIVRKCCV